KTEERENAEEPTWRKCEVSLEPGHPELRGDVAPAEPPPSSSVRDDSRSWTGCCEHLSDIIIIIIIIIIINSM
ncbi:uncharacterized, partial [Tachysurus ichikawai]